MRLARFWLRLALVALPVALGLGASGCHTYKYYDMHVTFDSASFTRSTAFSVFVCQVTVSGADSAEFDLPHQNSDQRCPNMIPTAPDPLDAGTFEFSTFADSGNLTFTLDAFQNSARTPDCLIGIGTATLPVTSEITTKSDLVIKKQPASCVDTGQHQGDANALPD